jgi:magnesium chelatase subunit D
VSDQPDTPDVWDDALLAAALLAIDPHGLGGAHLVAHAGPVRDEWLAVLRDSLPPDAPLRRLPIHAGAERLLGGLDLSATLRAQRPVLEQGLLAAADGGVVVAPMAERLSGGAIIHLCAAVDTGEVAVERDGMSARPAARIGVVALDESVGDDEAVAPSLLDRLAFRMDLRGISHRDMLDGAVDREDVDEARDRLAGVRLSDAQAEALCGAALALGVDSLRASILACRAAAAHAAYAERMAVEDDDLAVAARLVLAHRATRLPVPEEQEDPAPPPPDSEMPDDDDAARNDADKPLKDRVLEAAQAAIPADLLHALTRGRLIRRGANGGRRGESTRSKQRGRPAGVQRGDPRRGDRLNVIETLRAAAPWQRLRDRRAGGIAVRTDDFRTTRFKRHTETVTIFVVDASGSAALHRLAEVKGAVELLLADCYVRRDEVALVAFRGEGAELLLPPTRSLVRAKRALAGLPGGGATPLAAGLELAARLADGVRRKGQTPGLVILTDGRANVSRDGTQGRQRAGEDVAQAAGLIRRMEIAAVLVDSSPRPQPSGQALAEAMAASYLPLPHADSATLSTALRASGLAGPAPRRAAF